ncbi:MCE family protein [Rhodococcus oxybenzonivorans]|uniref:MCE family protein n=1 Tax=Rhodococcus oxybenzonivorans TaxID=1990687 RepID=UPI00295543F5|nr:MCE family protein [Rhodococcus oxybenzonivorans]MDV7353892.1 MCE family protein [Rhodococcus oxybenzonivorans]
MRNALKFGSFALVMLLVLALLVLVLGQIRLDHRTEYHAEFAEVSGLAEGDVVRLAGVDVGRVHAVELHGRNVAVEFDVARGVAVTSDARLQVRYANLLGDRYLELANGDRLDEVMPVGGTFPLTQTEAALDIDSLLGGLAPLARSLEPDQIDRLTGELIRVLQGQGGTITSILHEIAVLTSTLADRDALIGSVITNLGTVLGTIGDDSDAFTRVIDHLQQLVAAVAERNTPIADAIVHVDSASATLTDLLVADRPAIAADIAQTNRAATLLDDGSAQVEAVLSALPEAYQRLTRLGAYGSFFNFYLCAVTVKVDGPGGAPIVTKLVQQKQGRCVTPQ